MENNKNYVDHKRTLHSEIEKKRGATNSQLLDRGPNEPRKKASRRKQLYSIDKGDREDEQKPETVNAWKEGRKEAHGEGR